MIYISLQKSKKINFDAIMLVHKVFRVTAYFMALAITKKCKIT